MSGKDWKREVITIPNILSMVRLLLIPVIVWLYVVRREYGWTLVVLAASGLTDMADGYIARHFNMISDLGKALDPIADKLTQCATLFCLTVRFPLIWIPAILLVVKEALNAVIHIIEVRKTGVVSGSVWHGKVTTFLLYGMMMLHVIWAGIPPLLSNLCIAVCVAMMCVSMFLYTKEGIERIRKAG